MNKYDFIIQIIGGEKTGKTKLAYAIAKSIQKIDVNAVHCNLKREVDFSELKGKVALITEFSASDDPNIITKKKKSNKFVEAFCKVFGDRNVIQ